MSNTPHSPVEIFVTLLPNIGILSAVSGLLIFFWYLKQFHPVKLVKYILKRNAWGRKVGSDRYFFEVDKKQLAFYGYRQIKPQYVIPLNELEINLCEDKRTWGIIITHRKSKNPLENSDSRSIFSKATPPNDLFLPAFFRHQDKNKMKEIAELLAKKLNLKEFKIYRNSAKLQEMFRRNKAVDSDWEFLSPERVQVD